MARAATDMTAGVREPMISPAEVVDAVVRSSAAGDIELLVDPATVRIKALLAGTPEALELS